MTDEDTPDNTDLNNYILSIDDQINITSNSKLEQIFNQFIDNDLYIYGNFNKIPQFWFCKWYNDNRISGYNRGDFFWINTADRDSFLNDNAKQIQEYANVNPFISTKLPTWNKTNGDIYNAYATVLSGYNKGDISKALPPLWDIGFLSGPSQLLISQIDNNKHQLNEEKYWKPFLVTENDRDLIEQFIYSKIADTIAAHINNYHFSGENPTEQDINSLSLYANADFSNVDNMYPKNYLANGNSSSGFDIVDTYFKKPYPDRSISGEVSEMVWFRLWKSGFLEHGGIINIEHYRNNDKIIIPFNWELISDNACAYEIKYLGNGNNNAISVNLENSRSNEFLSVLYELDKSIYNITINSNSNSSTIKNAPIYYDTNYTIQLFPIYNASSNSVANGYTNLGNYSLYNNIKNNNITLNGLSVAGFSFNYSSQNTAKYYSYYIGGYCKN